MPVTNLVCTGEGIHLWGKSWLEHLFRNVNCRFHHYDKASDLELHKNCIVVTSTTENYFYLKRLQATNQKYGVILLSDECLDAPLFFLDDPNCRFLARNYLHPGCIRHPKVFHFGLGYKNEFERHAEPRRPSAKRKFIWSFTGSLKADRQEAIEKFSQFEPHYTYLVEKFNDPNYLKVRNYAETLNNSMFVLAPAGGASNDSFRIYEALECGAIPVVMRHTPHMPVAPSYWHGIFPGSEMPFIVADSWDDAAAQVKTLIDEKEVEATRKECVNFWRTWKKIWQKEFELQSAGLI